MGLNKRLKDLVGDELNEESAILAGALNLVAAQKVAEFNRDVDALVGIAERWLTLSRLLSDELSDGYGSIGFVAPATAEEIEVLKNELSGKRDDQSKSRIKVRKKSR